MGESGQASVAVRRQEAQAGGGGLLYHPRGSGRHRLEGLQGHAGMHVCARRMGAQMRRPVAPSVSSANSRAAVYSLSTSAASRAPPKSRHRCFHTCASGRGQGRGVGVGARCEEGAALHAAVAPGQLRAGVLWCAPGAAGLQPRGNPPISGVLRTPTLPPGPVLVASAPIRTTIWDPLSAKGRTPAALYSEAAFDLV